MVLKEWILLTNIIRTVIYYINSLLLVFEKRNIKHEMTNSPLSNIDENLTKDEYESIMNTSKKQENLISKEKLIQIKETFQSAVKILKNESYDEASSKSKLVSSNY